VDTANGLAAIAAVIFSAVSAFIAHRAATQARRQADVAAEQSRMSAQTSQSVNVTHFTSRFFDLIRDGMRFSSPEWTYQYWSLHATEFYFFHNGWLPRFIYQLWMVELVNRVLRNNPEVCAAHLEYLDLYSVSYGEMREFFGGLHEIARREHESVQARNAEITAYVGSWHATAADAGA